MASEGLCDIEAKVTELNLGCSQGGGTGVRGEGDGDNNLDSVWVCGKESSGVTCDHLRS